MLKKKLVNERIVFRIFEFFFIFLFIIFLLVSKIDVSFSQSLFFKQGQYINFDTVKSINIGMTKIELAGILGKPTFFVSKDVNCWCYYHYELLNHSNFRVRYLVLSFKEDILFDFKFFNSYGCGNS